jgi:microcin C transport system substrate-binding protein
MAKNRVQHDVATATAGPDLRAIVTAGLVGLAATLWAVQSRAADQPVTVAHGISTFGALKLPADFPHLP